jgi:NAD(P)-dependent dehydrogenase (short-subunit alcohol dehydrogenase family)
MAEGLAAQGAAVAIWGTNPDKNEAAVEQLSASGGEVYAAVCDVGDREAVRATMADVVAQLGRVDSCFVNAGVSGQAPSFVGMTDEEWHRVLRVNLDGAFHTAQAAAAHMVERFESGDRAGGSIVFTSSGSAFAGQQRGQHYAASKAGINAMMLGIAVEHARHGIRANSIVAGWTESEMTQGVLSWDKFVANNMPRVPLRRWGTKEDFAGIAAYLAGPASSYHTGDIITIDGGYSIF